uniref:UBC core domain-containing protein n=1 Tax=Panagrolaimus sp. JU765 TaxID=591449 RepID=A0AC34QQN5_9BILA
MQIFNISFQLVIPENTRSAMSAASVSAVTRLKKDYQRLLKDPVPYAIAKPLNSNILEWHYVVQGAKDTPYEGGYYHGKLVFPADFPFRPPSIYMITPSGRFQTDTRLCLSISDFHPDTWNPSWTVSTILMGLTSFMNENTPTYGSIQTTTAEKVILARKSKRFNLKNPKFCEVFDELAEQLQKEVKEEEKSMSSITEQNSERNKISKDSSSFTANIVLLTGVIALVVAVRYVILTANVGE